MSRSATGCLSDLILGKGKTNYSKSTEGIFTETVGGSGYTYAANLVKKIAKEKGVLPHQAQAIIWVAQKAIADEMDRQIRRGPRKRPRKPPRRLTPSSRYAVRLGHESRDG
jgi:hypothetical protein